MSAEKTAAAKHSKDYRDRKKVDAERFGIESLPVDMAKGTRSRMSVAMKNNGYKQLQEMLQHLHLSFLNASPKEQARRLKINDASCFDISPKLARQFKEASLVDARRDHGDEIIAPSPTR